MTRVPIDRETSKETAAAAAPDGAAASDAERIAALEAEVAELTGRHARALADYQNYRRRSEQRWAERARATIADSVARSLPVLDDLSRALASIDPDLAEHQWVDGIRLVEHKFQEMLASAGVEEIAGTDAAFDPLVHEAVSYGPGPDGRVIALVRAGYTIDEHVIRPAQVVVGDGTSPAQAPAESAATEGTP